MSIDHTQSFLNRENWSMTQESAFLQTYQIILSWEVHSPSWKHCFWPNILPGSMEILMRKKFVILSKPTMKLWHNFQFVSRHVSDPFVLNKEMKNAWMNEWMNINLQFCVYKLKMLIFNHHSNYWYKYD